MAQDCSIVDKKYIIPNLRNACRVLKLIGQDNRGYKITELAKPLEIPSTTALRITTTLQSEGFLRKENGLYFLGPVLIHLGSKTLAATELRDLAFPVLQRLSSITDETAHLALPCDDRSLIAAVCDSPHPLRAASSPGTLTDLYASATGKVFLGFIHRSRIGDIINRFPPKRRTSKSLMTVEELEAAADETAARGFGLDDEEFNHGVRCLAAPVRGAQGEVVAAMGITAATLRFSAERIPEMADKVKSAANELSRLLGHS